MPNKTLQVTLPQMGESVTEGVVGSWRKQVGEPVAAGETLVEIQTDKIDAEVPAPEAGRLARILAPEGETIAVGGLLAEIEVGAGGEQEPPSPPGPAAAGGDGGAATGPLTVVGEPVPVPLPQLGESVTEGVVGAWRKQVGDPVAQGEALVEIQTDKVDAEVPAPVSGVLREVLVPEGETVAAGTTLATIAAGATPPAAPRRPDEGRAPAEVGAEATPLARRRAQLAGVDLGGISGSGPKGLVRGRDVFAAGSGRPAAGGRTTSTEVKGAARALVDAMEESLTIPTATSLRTVEVAVLVGRRAQLNRAIEGLPQGGKVSYTHLVAFALAWAAREMPVFSTSLARATGDGAAGDGRVVLRRVSRPGVNLGLAVDVEKADGSRFLLVPVIRDAQELTFRAFQERYQDLVGRTRGGKLTLADVEGATITLTNPGGVGTVASVPRLMAGQAAVIAVGAIGPPPGFARLDQAGARRLGVSPVMTITSTYDHRLVQGVESGLLLARMERLLAGADRFFEVVAESLGVELPALEAESAEAPAGASGAASEKRMYAVAAGMSLVKAHRTHGHLAAHLDPLGSEPPGDPALEPETVKLTPELMAAVPAWMMRVMVPGATLAEALPHMRRTYCGTIAYEIEHISSHEQRVWLRKQIESGVERAPLASEQQLHLFRRLAQVDAFERFLRKTYLGQHTFSIEGLDALVPMLEKAIALLAQHGTREVVLGMAHRGRLNVTARIVGRSLEEIIAEFESGAYLGGASTGDVKYHYGAEGRHQTPDGLTVGVVLTHNPSHLEVVDAVVEGRTRALQTDSSAIQPRQDLNLAVPVLIHGDAAFTGQGVVTETLNLQGLEGYRVGGTVHIIANNQIGFTTDPAEGRSTRYASDVAKGYDIPIVHVNADDVEACLDAVRLAVSFRENFHRDVLIDLIGYRRFGHNEGDEPAYTQPQMMARIRRHPPVVQVYGAALVRRGLLGQEQVEQEQARAYQEMVEAHSRAVAQGQERLEAAAQPAGTMGERPGLPRVATQVPLERLVELERQLVRVPEGFQLNPKLSRQLDQRRASIASAGRLAWAQAEALALASLLEDGVPVRLTGQDSVRGTFSQRHLVLYDVRSGEGYAPIQHLEGARSAIELYNSPLSEMATLAFEYGYGVTRSAALVIWEAQYGDFFNNAQVVIDQFVAAGQAKWNQESRLTLLLPHGYEGSGPEHSSSRIERFLELGAEGNMRIAYPSTAAQYFHLLRLQALIEELRPLVLFTPKGGLRLPALSSAPEELAHGGFQEVLDRPGGERAHARRLILASGKLAHELEARRPQAGSARVALARLELLYPFPEEAVARLLATYPDLEEVIWAQEEPRNMGAFGYVARRLRRLLPARVRLGYAGRAHHAAPSEGSMRAHLLAQEQVLADAFGELAEAGLNGSGAGG